MVISETPSWRLAASNASLLNLMGLRPRRGQPPATPSLFVSLAFDLMLLNAEQDKFLFHTQLLGHFLKFPGRLAPAV